MLSSLSSWTVGGGRVDRDDMDYSVDATLM